MSEKLYIDGLRQIQLFNRGNGLIWSAVLLFYREI